VLMEELLKLAEDMVAHSVELLGMTLLERDGCHESRSTVEK
jgi:hypothetical protein